MIVFKIPHDIVSWKLGKEMSLSDKLPGLSTAMLRALMFCLRQFINALEIKRSPFASVLSFQSDIP